MATVPLNGLDLITCKFSTKLTCTILLQIIKLSSKKSKLGFYGIHVNQALSYLHERSQLKLLRLQSLQEITKPTLKDKKILRFKFFLSKLTSVFIVFINTIEDDF